MPGLARGSRTDLPPPATALSFPEWAVAFPSWGFLPSPSKPNAGRLQEAPRDGGGRCLKEGGAPCSMQEAEPQRPWVVDMSEHCARLFQGPAGVAVTLVCSAAQEDCGPPPARLPCLHMRDTEVRGDGSRGRPGTATGVLGFRGEGGAAGGLVALLAMLGGHAPRQLLSPLPRASPCLHTPIAGPPGLAVSGERQRRGCGSGIPA